MHRRRTKKTRLVYCEGAEDKAFLDCLKSVYAGDKYNVDIKPGTGGDQVHLAEVAIRKGSAYDDKYLKIDSDRGDDEMRKADALSEEHNLVVFRSIPMLEKLLINILEPSKSLNDSRWKSYFEKTYIAANKRTDVREYKKIFTKDVLDEAKTRLSELQALINIF